MSSSRNCTDIPANSDVAGIGIRLSMYITILITSLIPDVEATEELRRAYTTAIGPNVFALLITAMIETANRSLTFYHAIIIMHMLSFLAIAMNPFGSYRGTLLRLLVFWIATRVGFTLLFCWIIYVWTTAPTFGAPGACNSATTYVLLFVNIRATIGGLRWFFVTIAVISLLVIFPTLIYDILALKGLSNNQEVRDASVEGNPMTIVRAGEASILERGVIMSLSGPGPGLQWMGGGSSNTTTPHDPTATQAVHAPPQRAVTALRTGLLNKIPHFLRTASGQRTLGRFVITIYGITTLELTVLRNKKNVVGDENQWTFGQIVAMLVTAGSLNDVFHFILAVSL